MRRWTTTREEVTDHPRLERALPAQFQNTSGLTQEEAVRALAYTCRFADALQCAGIPVVGLSWLFRAPAGTPTRPGAGPANGQDYHAPAQWATLPRFAQTARRAEPLRFDDLAADHLARVFGGVVQLHAARLTEDGHFLWQGETLQTCAVAQ